MKQSFQIPENCTTVTVEQVENKIVCTFEEKFEPKDGEIITWGHGRFGIFKSRISKDECIFYLYVNLDCGYKSSLSWCLSETRRLFDSECVLATESEKQTLLDALAKDGKKWNAELKLVEKLRWRAEYGGMYYYATQCMGEMIASESCEKHERSDNAKYVIGNYFRTKKQAQAVADRINAIFAESL